MRGSKDVKQERQKRTQKRAAESVLFAFIRGLRGHSTLYILFCRLLFVYLSSSSHTSIFLVFFLTVSFRLSSRFSPFRCTFVPTTLYHPAIISHTCHPPPPPPSLSFSRFRHNPPWSLRQSPCFTPSRRYHPTFYKIYVCRRTSDVAAGYLFFQ